jgi:hypothetical protein
MNTSILLHFITEEEEEGELEFDVNTDRVLRIDETLIFEAPAHLAVTPGDLHMKITDAQESFFINRANAHRSVNAAVDGLSARPTDGSLLVELLQAHPGVKITSLPS